MSGDERAESNIFNTFQQLSKEAKELLSPRQSYTSQLGLLNIPPSPAASAGSSSAGRRGKVCRGGTWLGTAAAETWGSAVSGAAPATTRAEYNTTDVMPKEGKGNIYSVELHEKHPPSLFAVVTWTSCSLSRSSVTPSDLIPLTRQAACTSFTFRLATPSSAMSWINTIHTKHLLPTTFHFNSVKKEE